MLFLPIGCLIFLLFILALPILFIFYSSGRLPRETRSQLKGVNKGYFSAAAISRPASLV